MNENCVQFGFTDEEMVEPKAIGCNLHKNLQANKQVLGSNIRYHVTYTIREPGTGECDWDYRRVYEDELKFNTWCEVIRYIEKNSWILFVDCEVYKIVNGHYDFDNATRIHYNNFKEICDNG